MYLTYAAPRGHALIDRSLYLPRSWVDDPARCAAAGIPADVESATKPASALRMIGAALDGVGASWVTGDEVYGNDPPLRAGLRDRTVGYVMAVSCDHRIPTNCGPVRADSVARGLPPLSWRQLSAGAGSKCQRTYSWAFLSLFSDEAGEQWILMRRKDSTGELAFYRCDSPKPLPLGELVRVAGRRWTVEESFQTANGQAGLDQHQVRTWTSSGTAESPWPCSRWHSWPSSTPTNATPPPHRPE